MKKKKISRKKLKRKKKNEEEKELKRTKNKRAFISAKKRTNKYVKGTVKEK